MRGHRLLALAGFVFLAGGGLHPKDDLPEGGTLLGLLHTMFTNPLWWPSHSILLVAMVLFTVSFWLLRNEVPRLRRLLSGVAVTSALATLDMLLHLIAPLADESAAAGRWSPLLLAHAGLEATTVPLWALSLCVLAVAGAATRALGSWLFLPIGCAGALAYALANGGVWFTYAVDPLFPAAAGIGAWAVLVAFTAEASPAPARHLP